MKKAVITLIALILLGSTLACNIIPQMPDIQMPDIDIQVPTLEVGEMQDERQAIPLSGAKAATAEIIFGAGELEIEAGTSDDLFSGHFRYNVERWEPEVTYEGDVLTIKQGALRKTGASPPEIPTTNGNWNSRPRYRSR